MPQRAQIEECGGDAHGEEPEVALLWSVVHRQVDHEQGEERDHGEEIRLLYQVESGEAATCHGENECYRSPCHRTPLVRPCLPTGGEGTECRHVRKDSQH